ncbi:MAG: YaiI/YqxD family protein [Burkholderiales bacterium]|nr:YaiI/YqxD family protein [Burkholderiales bacterium]
MKIYIDADACPKPVKEVLFNLAKNLKHEIIFVTNQFLTLPILPNLRLLQVARGFDVADDEIVKLVDTGDLVISNDIPLASQVIAKGAETLTTSGKLYTAQNIQQQLAVRDLIAHLRDNLQVTSHSKPFSTQDKANFANAINKWLTTQAK